MKQTAVEWLVKQLKLHYGMKCELYEEFEQAKAMEKEQIIDAYNEGVKTCGMSHIFIETAEKHYNETFKSE